MKYDKLIEEADEEGISTYENNMIGDLKGLYVSGTITINSDIDTKAEKTCVLAEELGHHYTTYGNITDQSEIVNRKLERVARVWGYTKLINPSDLVEAHKSGVRNRYELAEFLEVTEEFLEEALEYFKQKYGAFITLDNYIVYFEPLGVFERF